MSATYSTYEAKAKFSEILRRVRDGENVIVTWHGEPVAEIRPIEKAPETLEERLAELERQGLITPAATSNRDFRPLANRPGALQRFLDERD